MRMTKGEWCGEVEVEYQYPQMTYRFSPAAGAPLACGRRRRPAPADKPAALWHTPETAKRTF